MRKRNLGVTLALSAVLLLGVVAAADAFPNKTSSCTGCHSADAAVVVTATQTANNGSTATYSVSVSNTFGDGVSGWAVFDGASNVANGYGAGSFSVAVGKTYTVWGVAGAGGQGAKSITISPIAPPPPPPATDTTPPTVNITAPAANSTVAGTVSITANASDAGTGVKQVEFRVDGVLVGTDTTAPYSASWNAAGAAAGAHTIQAKAIDGAALSTAASVQVSIATPPPPPVAQTSAITISVKSATGPIAGAKVVVKNTVTGARYVLVTNSSGIATIATAPFGTYSMTARARGYRSATVKLVADAAAESTLMTLVKR